ncbi:hypothetical protein BC828DRAFT_374845 [Blastocladiella britannica]|nr:hypothetical protein BC828DRAFT_374845 [Blastocladiella britannica]
MRLVSAPIADLFAAESLTTLVLSDNALTAIPEELRSLTSLKQLMLANNRIATLPASTLENMPALETLHLGGNALTTGAVNGVNWAWMPTIRRVYLMRNQLDAVPRSLLIDTIETLALSDNQIQTIPPEISAMTCLQWLGLAGNRITSFAPLLALTRPLSGLTVAHNPAAEGHSVDRALRHVARCVRLSPAASSPIGEGGGSQPPSGGTVDGNGGGTSPTTDAVARARTWSEQLESTSGAVAAVGGRA